MTAGLGLRFARDVQPLFEGGLGSNHFLLGKSFSIVPEYRIRLYNEQRTQSTFVMENLFQLGASWLL
jgi:hypothetical protein